MQIDFFPLEIRISVGKGKAQVRGRNEKELIFSQLAIGSSVVLPGGKSASGTLDVPQATQ